MPRAVPVREGGDVRTPPAPLGTEGPICPNSLHPQALSVRFVTTRSSYQLLFQSQLIACAPTPDNTNGSLVPGTSPGGSRLRLVRRC